MRAATWCIVVALTLVGTVTSSIGSRSLGVSPANHYLLRLSDTDGWFADVTTVEAGKPATLTHAALPTLEFTPRRVAEALVVRVTSTNGDSLPEASREIVQDLTLMLGQLVHFEGAGYSFDVEWVLTEAVGSAAPGSRKDPEPCELCCVTCGDRRTCACRVEVPCGECCCPGCCIAGDRTTGTTIVPAAPCTAGPRTIERGAATGERR
jgi:hypothetical protein